MGVNMQIYVCIKQVPDTASNIRPLQGVFFDEEVKYIANPYDENALEQALRIREEHPGSEIVAVTVGKDTAAATLRFALAMGADRGILVKTETYFNDHPETSQLLKRAIELDGNPSLILTGKQSIDVEGMQIPYRLAVLFDMPVVVNIVAFSMKDGLVTVERELEGDVREVIEMRPPCIVGAAKGLNQPRCPTLPDIMKARKKEIKLINRIDLGIETADPQIELLELQSVPERGRGTLLKGHPEEMVDSLLQFLKEEAKVL
jgi:electron transfer flavoprotein beta subunit